MRPQRILVLGGTGFIGRAVCEALVERAGGAGAITVPTRRAGRDHDLRTLPGIEIAVANVHDDRALERLVSGQHAVVNLVGILHGSEAEFQRTHVDLPTRLARAATAAGVRRLVHVSAIGADPGAPSRYLRSKGRAEAALKASGLDVTLLQPSVVFGADDRFINLFAAMQRVAPFVPLAGADARFQPVWVEDVARAVASCLDRPASIGQTIECTGPEVFTLRQLVECAGRWAGTPRPVLPLGRGLGRLQALVMEWLPGGLMSRDNVDSMQVPSIASGMRPGLAQLGIAPTSLAAVMRPLLEGRLGTRRLDAYRAEARHH